MSKKSPKIAAIIKHFQGRDLDAHYLGYFECFNEALFFEAHEVLEELWLRDKHAANYSFHKGLIQLAGAFVHLQKNRLRPAVALFSLAQTNLEKYPPIHDQLNVVEVLGLIEKWRDQLESNQFELNPLTPKNHPSLKLVDGK